MKRAIAAGAVGTALVVAGLTGCSGNKTSSTSAGSGSTGGSSAPVVTKVVVDGQAQDVTGATTCTPAGDNINIGVGDPTNGVGAVVTNTDPPAVHAVGLGSPNGSTLGFSDAAAGQGSAEVTKASNGYEITGNAVGLDATSAQPVTKPFELDVACP